MLNSKLKTRNSRLYLGGHQRMDLTAKGVVFGNAILLFACLAINSEVIEAALQGRRPNPSASAQRLKKTDDLFKRNCARCHGADGRGDTALGRVYNSPDFTDAEWWRKHANITSNKALTSIVSHGKGGMPAFGKKLSQTDIASLINYVRRFKQ